VSEDDFEIEDDFEPESFDNGLPGPWSKYQSADPGIEKARTPGLMDEPEGFSYPFYKAARSVPIIGELAAKGADYVADSLDSTRDLDAVRADREQREGEWDARNPRSATMGAIAGSMVNPIKITGIPLGQPTSKMGAFGKGLAEVGGVVTREAAIAGTDAGLRGNNAVDATLTAGALAGGVGLGARGLSGALPKYVLGINDPKNTALKYRARKSEINAASEENLYDEVVDASDEIGRANKTADDAAREADLEYRGAKEALRTELKGTRPPEFLAGRVKESVDKLGKRVSAGSSQAFDVLAKSNVEIPLPRIKAFLTVKLNRYKFNNTSFPGAEKDMAVIQQWRSWFDDIGDKAARPEEMKRIVQYLDDQSRQIWAKIPGERTMAEMDLLEFRQYIDAAMKKDVPGYAEAMAPVADDMKVLSVARRMFNDERRADKALQRVGKPFEERDLQVLQELEKRTDSDLLGPMQEYMSSQRSLSGPSFSQKSEMLPEYASAQRLRQERDVLAERTKFSTRFKENNAQASLKRLRSAGQDPIKLRRDLEELSNESGINFVQMNDDLAMKEMFRKGFQHGSRNVNLGAMTGQAAASFLVKAGAEVPVVGPFIGAVGGAVIDRSGPMIYKWALDASDTKIYKSIAVPIRHALERTPQLASRMIQEEQKKNPELLSAMSGHMLGQKFAAQYGGALEEAQKQGPKKLGLTISLILRKNPEYAPFVQYMAQMEGAQ